ncbi:hypothetical protein FF38_02632 [Lucilia cuprina]|uniref:Uncharacterized protein n=1 Tax=Lucilia cuprina TaxID=7375 RepID=A0A0L0CFR5_LUCCU|nr:hypothetical protein FF38_02632 [Lucilia cuprina]
MSSNHIGWAGNGSTLRYAIPLLLTAGALCCWFSPLHPSLANLNTLDSSMVPILTASLVRTFRQHEEFHHSEPPASDHSTFRPHRSVITEDANLPVEILLT